MAQIVQLFDHLRNALTGMGMRGDPRTSAIYAPTPWLGMHEIDAAYRGSGLLRKIVQIPAHDTVREWREWRLPAEEVTAVEAEESRLGIRQKVREAEVLRGLGGGAFVLITPGDPASPLEPATIGRGGLVAVNVVSRWHLTGVDWVEDLASPLYGTPQAFEVNSQRRDRVRIHPSRVVCFRGDRTAASLGMVGSHDDVFWGESVIAQVLDAVKDCDSARASFAALLHKARALRIGIPGLMDMVATEEGSKRIDARMAILAAAEGIHRAVVFDSGGEDGKGGETISDATYSFTGAKDMLNAYAEFVAAISDIPATRLLGRAPEGMNSSGTSQQADWNKAIRARQTLDLGPCIDQLDRVLLQSALGKTPDGAWYDWTPLDTPSQADEATRFKTFSEALEKVQTLGVVPDTAFAEAAQSVLVEAGWLPALEAALARVPESERFGSGAEV